MTDLLAVLAGWDGKETASLTRLLSAAPPDQDQHDLLLDLLSEGSDREQDGATWLLLGWARTGHPLDASRTRQLVALLPRLRPWMSQLHVCQMLRHLPIAAADRAAVDRFLGVALTSNRPFVRAWAWDALATLHVDDPGIAERLATGLDDPAASVQSRVRALRKALGRH